MGILVIKEDMRSEGLEKLILTQAAKEVGLIDIDTPLAQGLDDAEMRRQAARGNNGKAQWRELDGGGERLLYLREFLQQVGKRSLLQWDIGILLLVLVESVEALAFEAALRLIGENHSVGIESNLHAALLGVEIGWRSIDERRGTDARVHHTLHVALVL